MRVFVDRGGCLASRPQRKIVNLQLVIYIWMSDNKHASKPFSVFEISFLRPVVSLFLICFTPR